MTKLTIVRNRLIFILLINWIVSVSGTNTGRRGRIQTKSKDVLSGSPDAAESNTLLGDLSLELFGIVYYFIELVDETQESLAHTGLEALLFIDQCIDCITIISEPVQRRRDVMVVVTPTTIKPLSHRSNA